MVEGGVEDEGVEVWAVGEALRVGGEPAPDVWIVVATTKENERGFYVDAFRREAPGVERVQKW